jgi:hypothetical protein
MHKNNNKRPSSRSKTPHGGSSSRGGKPSAGRGGNTSNVTKSPRGPMSQGPVKKHTGITQDFFPRSSVAAASNNKT